jgi:hypothetical protein
VTVMVVHNEGCCSIAEVAEGYGCVVEVGQRWVGVAFGPVMALVFAPVGEGC